MTHAEEQGKAIRKIVVGAIIAQYGGIEILDSTKGELKMRVKRLICAVKDLENYFIYNPNSNDHYREVFKKQFLSDEIVLLSELVETVWGLKVADLEEIIEAIKANINHETT